MGGPAANAAVAVQPAGGGAAADVVPPGGPFRCLRRRCTVYMDFAPAWWIAQHLKLHDYQEEKEKEFQAKREAARAAAARAAGPSANRKKDPAHAKQLPANQRGAGKGNRGGPGKKKARGRS